VHVCVLVVVAYLFLTLFLSIHALDVLPQKFQFKSCQFWAISCCWHWCRGSSSQQQQLNNDEGTNRRANEGGGDDDDDDDLMNGA